MNSLQYWREIQMLAEKHQQIMGAFARPAGRLLARVKAALIGAIEKLPANPSPWP